MAFPIIAVALDTDGTISPHAGRALSWRVYSIEGQQPTHVWDLTLTELGSLHEWHVRGDGNRHPLHSVDVAIAGSGGEGVTRRLAERNTVLTTTTETEPLAAVIAYLEGSLPAGLPHREEECLKATS
ncbi:hypothetical protein [Halioxenophilus sp. WMMB6]|uniref:NifB/NifX family molybdenum-iron cluster-binding protein n=1 Tax=Halioxenophilus sp. WMMB6 TaxID=3073815 RepID=UPI00295E78DB|nr:hypothetical protein [Halioxenophilus sp. WMMB6]